MKILLSVIGVFFLAIVIYFFVLGYLSQAKAANGLVDGKLSACGNKPNCVSSEMNKESDHFIEPIKYQGDDNIRLKMLTAITAMNGEVESDSDEYIAATFTSGFFRFTDDVEIRIVAAEKTIHLRSASRVGHSDFGVNRKRMETLRSLFNSVE